MAPHALAKRGSADGNNSSVFASFIIFLSIFIIFLTYGVWRRRQLARRQHALMVEWGLAGIDGLDNNTWPWWRLASPKAEPEPPKFVDVWLKSCAPPKEAQWADFVPLSATFIRQPVTSTSSAARQIPAGRPVSPSPPTMTDPRSRMRQWLSFSAPRPIPATSSPPTAPAPDPVYDVQVGFLLAMPSQLPKDIDPKIRELGGLVIGFTRASWEGDIEQKVLGA